MDYETKLEKIIKEQDVGSGSTIVRAMALAFIADAISTGTKRIAKSINKLAESIEGISIEIQDDS